jgi:flagellar biosynthetic protein FlhB
MAEEQGSFQERTEEATPKRREDARREGQVARSPELASALVLGAALGVFLVAGGWMQGQLQQYMGQRMQFPAHVAVDLDNAPAILREAGALAVLVLSPLLLAVAAAGFLANASQVGILFTGKPIEPTWSRIDPIKGFANLFSLRSLTELGKSLLKVGVVALAVWIVLRKEIPWLGQLVFLPVDGLLPALGGIVWRMVGWVLALLLAIAVLDVSFQRWDLARRLRMSVQDIRDEMKQSEGDPQLKRRQRSVQMDTAYNRMLRELPQADVVVANPIHLAVALRYEPGQMRAPRVLAKGRRLVAQRIKDLAREHGIPVIEDKPLARALFKACAVGDEIPGDLYRAVAELLAFVYRMKKRSA